MGRREGMERKIGHGEEGGHEEEGRARGPEEGSGN